MKVCSKEDCDKATHTAGRCKYHYDRDRYAANRERLLEQSKNYALANPEKTKARQKRWRDANKVHITAKNKRNYLARKEHYDANRAKWRKENRLKWNSYRRARYAKEKENGIFLILNKEYKKLNNQPCFYCGSWNQPTIDHVIPIARGGRHSIGNIVVACKPCNSQKNKRTIQEWRKLRCALQSTQSH